MARLMRHLGLEGVHRRRKWATIRSPEASQRRTESIGISGRAAQGGSGRRHHLHPDGSRFIYLAVVVDAFSRAVVGWSMANHLRTELVLNALQMAVRRRRIAPGAVHRPAQYTSIAFGQHLREAGLLASMGSRGDGYDNALCESLFASLERGLLDRTAFGRREEARYGCLRLHRVLVQPVPPPLLARHALAARLRALLMPRFRPWWR